jgi:NAD(P)-dependent dehydrogenase (short-subunit alcohol dehydrogenase family)
MPHWTTANIEQQTGRVAVVTGANSGIGYQIALELARHGARVIAACRDPRRGAEAVARMRAEVPSVAVELGILDLADLDSVHGFAQGFLGREGRLDLLVNNAAVMAVPDRHESAQGFELQLATNHLGHFALTGLLMPAIRDLPGSRVVTVTSLNHRPGHIHFDDLQLERSYTPYRAYNQSKLANAMFTLELERRLKAHAAETISVGAHPGFTCTALQWKGPRLGRTTLEARALGVLTRVFGQSEAMGALPVLYAAVAPRVYGGEYFGPDGVGEARGHPERVEYSPRSHDRTTASKLWSVSEELTGVRFLD